MSNVIKKNELAELIAEKYGTTKKAALESVNQVFDAVAQSLQNGDSVDVFGFGKFSVAERSARTGINPRTGEKIEVAASKSVKFKVSKALKDSVK